MKPLWSKLGLVGGLALGGLDMWVNEIFGMSLFGTLRHGKTDAESTRPAAEFKPIDYPKPDGVISFDRLTNLAFSGTNHEEDQPVHLQLKDRSIPIRHTLPIYAEPAQRYCPAGVYEVVRRERRASLPNQRAELRSLQNLRHQGPAAEYQLGGAAGRRWPELSEYVIGRGSLQNCELRVALRSHSNSHLRHAATELLERKGSSAAAARAGVRHR